MLPADQFLRLLLQGLPSVPRPASIYTGPNVDTSIHSAPSSYRATFMQPSFSRSLLWDSKNRKRPASSTYRKGGNKRKRIPIWTHTFVCLANIDQKTVPDSQERADLLLAGLGEKKITLDEFSHSQEIYSELIFQFPKLSQAGGFELLRVSEGSGKVLQEIASPKNGYTVPYLRAVVHHAVIYIRPMQKDLSLDQEDTAVSNVFPLGSVSAIQI